MNSDPNWSFEAVQSLVARAREGAPVSVISLKLKRSITNARAKINDLGLNPPAEAQLATKPPRNWAALLSFCT